MVSALIVRGPLVIRASSASTSKQQHRERASASEFRPQSSSSIPQRLAAASLAFVLASSSSSSTAALAEELVATPLDAPALFSKNCAGCHAGGGNVVSPGNSLSEADLGRNGLLSAERLFEVIYSGKGKMPGYGAGCAPRGACTFAARLSDGEVKALGDFVLERAGQGWK